jgi:hypothetical protein
MMVGNSDTEIMFDVSLALAQAYAVLADMFPETLLIKDTAAMQAVVGRMLAMRREMNNLRADMILYREKGTPIPQKGRAD